MFSRFFLNFQTNTFPELFWAIVSLQIISWMQFIFCGNFRWDLFRTILLLNFYVQVNFQDNRLGNFFFGVALPANIRQSYSKEDSITSLRNLHIVSNKAKVRILKRVLQENKACQMFRKTNIFYPLIRTHACVYHGVRNVRFSENLAWFVFLYHLFWYSPFFLIADDITFSLEQLPTAASYLSFLGKLKKLLKCNVLKFFIVALNQI